MSTTTIVDRPAMVGRPSIYVDPSGPAQIVVYRTAQGDIQMIFVADGDAESDNLSAACGAPAAVTDPSASYDRRTDTHRVRYRDENGSINEISWSGSAALTHRRLVVRPYRSAA